MAGPWYFAYVGEGVAFNSVTHAVFDEVIFSIEIAQNEGDFATLTIEVPHPTVGLLSAGRNLWCWLSHDEGSGPEAVFNGRLIGVPQKLADEVVALQFVARPADFVAQKTALADTLKTLPYYDPIWLQDRLDDPDTVLETRAALWDINRTTLVVSTTDIVTGEAGTLSIGEGDHFYDDLDVSYSDAPLRSVKGTLTVQWDQAGTGELDLTRQLVSAFQAGGSPTIYPMVSSLTGPGLLGDWPKAGDTVSTGWSMADDSSITEASWLTPPLQTWVYTRPHYQDVTVVNEPGKFVYVPFSRQADGTIDPGGLKWKPAKTTPGKIISGYDQYALTVPLGIMVPKFRLAWEASRRRSETITFTLEADTQSLLVDAGAAETETFALNSSAIDQPIDDGGALPIIDPLRNSYFKTDRGARSIEYALLWAKAQLVSRARAVRIKMALPWSIGKAISCRHNIALTDRRLPGTAPQATGKVISYRIIAAGEGDFHIEATIGCTIGHAVALSAPLTGTPDYVEDGYVASGYQTSTGGEIALIADELQYESPDNFVVVDDGLDLTNVTASAYVTSLTVSNGPNAQRNAIADAIQPPSLAPAFSPRTGVTILYGDVGANNENEPSTVLENHPTKVSIEMVPIGSQSFAVTYTPAVSTLVIPKTIDLEAA